MSGGVDSSVAAARCVARGLDTFGITLAMWPRDRDIERDRGCCSIDAVEDARRVATTLGIAHYTWNLEDEFQEQVIADFTTGYAGGRTPNPCVRCNERVKFGVLLDRAIAAGATHVATGHHARMGRRAGRFTLHRSLDGRKDQAYTLHRLSQAQLKHAAFPLGFFADKAAVRAEATRLGLGTAAKPDSQELCFVADTLVAELETRLRGRFRPGPIVDRSGEVVGEHRGLPFYTVGQRSRLGLAPDRADSAPFFVLSLDVAANAVLVGPREALLRDEVLADECTWISSPPGVGTSCTVQLRAHGIASPATVLEAGASSLRVRCAPRVSQVSPGQAVVVYDGDEVLGGGIVGGSR